MVILTFAAPSLLNAHCDTMNGPVIKDARVALEKNDVNIVLKWVKKDHEAEIKSLFIKTVTARSKFPETKDLVDQLFFETLVRLHRAGEGEPYTGLKDEEVKHSIQEADNAIAKKKSDELIANVVHNVERLLHQRFEKVIEAQASMNTSVDAGRAYVETYVQFVHFVEQLDALTAASDDKQVQKSGNHHH